MASHKVLKSVARAVAESFTGLMNYWKDDYVLGHLLSAARACRRAELDVDLLSGVARPKELLVEAVRLSLPRLTGEGFSDLVKRSGSDLSFVHTARMTVRFELDAVRKHSQDSDILESPYSCAVRLIDDRGRVYAAEVKGWWFPEVDHGPNGGTF